ncbi:MAG TPA: hypothetical protein PKJ51_07620 [Methanothrix sp.]|nr:hypothetical protein [Methanothrix sp.]
MKEGDRVRFIGPFGAETGVIVGPVLPDEKMIDVETDDGTLFVIEKGSATQINRGGSDGRE